MRQSSILFSSLVLMSGLAYASPAAATDACQVANAVRYGTAPAVHVAALPRIFWMVDTGPAKAVMLRLDNSNDRFVIHWKTDSDIHLDDCLRSGDTLRLSARGTSDYLISDTSISSSMVKVSRDYGPPLYKGTGTFFIEKLAGTPGREIRYGDSFRIRGTYGNAWLCLHCVDMGPYVQLSQRPDYATAWTFVP